ncbi:MAG: 3-oxoacyl-ACP reductase family protein [Chthonomonadales bacterium]
MNVQRKLEGKVALVTGAGRGLGRSYALKLASLGANVVVNDISLQAHKEFDEELEAESVMAECELHGVRSIGIEADVMDRDAVFAMVDRTVETFGRLDVLVTNAGGMLRPIEGSGATDMTEDDYRFIMDVNLSSTVFCCQAVAPVMKKQGSGKIITVSSQAGVRTAAIGTFAAYSMAKAAIVSYSRILAGELGPHGINVNVIAPGLILTSRANKQFGRHLPENQEKAIVNIPLRRLGLPEDCAKVVEFLATDLSDYVTGQVIPICGGMVLSPS